MCDKNILKNIFCRIVVITVFAAAAACFSASACLAQSSETKSGSRSDPVFTRINPPPEFDAGGIMDKGRPEDFFQIVGTVNLIEGRRIIVGDREFAIASGTSTSGVKRWSRVGLRLNKKGEVVVCERLRSEPH